MKKVVKSTSRRHAREKAKSSSATATAAAAAAVEAAAAATAAVKNSSAFNESRSYNSSSSIHFQNTGDDATFGGLNHLTGSYEKVDNERKPAAPHKQQPAGVSADKRKITTSNSNNENNQQPKKVGDYQPPQAAVAALAAAAAATASASVEAPAAPAVEPPSKERQPRPLPESIPKFVRVGQKVCFSTVVAAVLIPSSEDISEASKRELWWQATDYAEFRLNYAMLMQDPSLEKDDHDYANNRTNDENNENCYGYDTSDSCSFSGGGGGVQANENTVPYAVASVDEPSGPATAGYHCGNNGGGMHVTAARTQHAAPTATVEGVLVVAAAPAPAVLGSRPYASNELCYAGMGPGGKQDGMFKGNGFGPAVSSPGQGRSAKSSRHEPAARPRSGISPDEHQQKLAFRRRGGAVGGATVTPLTHSHAYVHRRHHQAYGGQRITRGGRSAPACYGGRRDAWNESEYAISRGDNFQHTGVGSGGGLFFMNRYPAGVYDAPPPRTAYVNNALYGHETTMAEAYLPAQQHQQRHHHAHGSGMAGGVGGLGGGVGYAPSLGGLGAPSVVMVQAPSSSQFSMWRSQLVFSPVMMQ